MKSTTRFRMYRSLLPIVAFGAVATDAYAQMGGCPISQACQNQNNARVTEAGEPYAVVDGWIVVHGDVMIAPESDLKKGVSIRGLVTTDQSKLWPNAIMRYTIDASIPQNQRSVILAAISDVSDDTGFIFQEGATGDYVRFRAAENPDAGVCTAQLGRVGGEQFITLVPGCTRGTIIHEIGHALGIQHEHQRDDREDFVTVNIENACERPSMPFEILTTGFQNLGPYDYDSIMHYGRCAFSDNGLETITAPQEIGLTTALSEGDINTIRAMYEIEVDDDGDGLTTSFDNCVDVPNPDQIDTDRDAIGNACDGDLSNDGIINFIDISLMSNAFFSAPGDPTWHQNADLNGDGAINFFDYGDLTAMFQMPPGPSGYTIPNAACPAAEPLTCAWQPQIGIFDTNSTTGIVLLDLANFGPSDRSLESVQWQLNGGSWQKGNVTAAGGNGTATFCAPGPGTYTFRASGYGAFAGPSNVGELCSTCSAPTASTTITGTSLPTCSAGLPPLPAAPDTPTGFGGADAGTGRVFFIWTPVDSTADSLSYEINYSNQFAGGDSLIVPSPAGDALTGLLCNGEWDFTIRACASNSAGTTCSVPSASSTVTVVANPSENCADIPATGSISTPGVAFEGIGYQVSCGEISNPSTALTYVMYESSTGGATPPAGSVTESGENCAFSFVHNDVSIGGDAYFYWTQACETNDLTNCGPFTGPAEVLVLRDNN